VESSLIHASTGEVFSYPIHRTWEFTSQHPIRSVFPLWLFYGLPMSILRSIWGGLGHDLSPATVYWTLRCLMFTLSFVLEDWALQELVHTTRQRRVAMLLVASSYVTWTYQTHTFSNAIETLLVLWCLVLIGRIVEDKVRFLVLVLCSTTYNWQEHTGIYKCGALAFLSVLGIFNRITFPAFILLPSLQLLPHFQRKPLAFWSLILFGGLTAYFAVYVDTEFYTPTARSIRDIIFSPVITPLNNLMYNSSRNNLSRHGLHPPYQHIVANLPQLLGPAYPLVFTSSLRRSTPFISAIFGVLVLSFIPHQEARFLIPAIPLILSSIRLPRRFSRLWISSWVIFNVVFGMLMGTYHQGGVVPMQSHIANVDNVSQVLWWKTYPPPIWLLDGKNECINTHDLMGISGDRMIQEVLAAVPCSTSAIQPNATFLVAPASAAYIHELIVASDKPQGLVLEEKWRYQRHLNLDDIDFGGDGILPTLRRVVGRRGLVLWQVSRQCKE